MSAPNPAKFVVFGGLSVRQTVLLTVALFALAVVFAAINVSIMFIVTFSLAAIVGFFTLVGSIIGRRS